MQEIKRPLNGHRTMIQIPAVYGTFVSSTRSQLSIGWQLHPLSSFKTFYRGLCSHFHYALCCLFFIATHLSYINCIVSLFLENGSTLYCSQELKCVVKPLVHSVILRLNKQSMKCLTINWKPTCIWFSQNTVRFTIQTMCLICAHFG